MRNILSDLPPLAPPHEVVEAIEKKPEVVSGIGSQAIKEFTAPHSALEGRPVERASVDMPYATSYVRALLG